MNLKKSLIKVNVGESVENQVFVGKFQVHEK